MAPLIKRQFHSDQLTQRDSKEACFCKKEGFLCLRWTICSQSMEELHMNLKNPDHTYQQTGKIVKSYHRMTLDTEIQPIFSKILKSYGQDFSSSYGALTSFDCKLTIVRKETPLFCQSMILLNPLELTDPNKTVFLQRWAINLS